MVSDMETAYGLEYHQAHKGHDTDRNQRPQEHVQEIRYDFLKLFLQQHCHIGNNQYRYHAAPPGCNGHMEQLYPARDELFSMEARTAPIMGLPPNSLDVL